MPPAAPIDLSRCPLCGGDNACALARATDEPTRCWCWHAVIPAAVLERVPSAARDQVCVCQDCARAAPESAQKRLGKLQQLLRLKH